MHIVGGSGPGRRALNERSVLAHLQRVGTDPISGIAATTGLSRPTVEGVLAALTRLGLVEAVRAGRSGTVGRPAVHYRFRAERGYVVGVDAGPDQVRARLADLAGRELVTSTVYRSAPDALAVEPMTAFVTQLLGRVGAGPDRLWALTIGAPWDVEGGPDGGSVGDEHVGDPVAGDRAENGGAVGSGPAGTADLARSLGERLPGAVRLERDTELAALADHADTAARDSMVGLLFGRRVAASVVDDAGPRPHVGGLASLPDVAWDAAHPFTDDGQDAGFLDEVAAATAELLQRTGASRVVVGARAGRTAESLVAPLREALARHVPGPLEVVGSRLGADAVSRGALRRALALSDAALAARIG